NLLVLARMCAFDVCGHFGDEVFLDHVAARALLVRGLGVFLVEVDAAHTEMIICGIEPEPSMQDAEHRNEIFARSILERIEIKLAHGLDSPGDGIPGWRMRAGRRERR